MELNGAAQIEETATQLLHFALLLSVPRVQLSLTTILGNCGCVAIASFLGVPSTVFFTPEADVQHYTAFIPDDRILQTNF
jgi:hypothetical protein